jgi:hypothetical protein
MILVLPAIVPCCGQVHQYFPSQKEACSLNTLAAAAQLMRSNSHEAKEWVQLYAHPHWKHMQQILVEWLPEQMREKVAGYHEVKGGGGRVREG